MSARAPDYTIAGAVVAWVLPNGRVWHRSLDCRWVFGREHNADMLDDAWLAEHWPSISPCQRCGRPTP